jgi:hypothetical protein
VLGVPSSWQRFRSQASASVPERFNRVLQACSDQVKDLREPFDGALELCETTAGGGARKGKRGCGAAGKVVVFGIIRRNGRVKAMPVPAHDSRSVMDEIEARGGRWPSPCNLLPSLLGRTGITWGGWHIEFAPACGRSRPVASSA